MDMFRAMQVFVTVADAGSMTAASATLGLSPAMVGQHISALERRLDTRLLNRTTRSQSLTDFGASYLQQCRDILERVAAAEQEAEASQTQARGKLRITAPTTFGEEALIPALGRYRAIAPGVTLDITLTNRNVDLVEEGFDIAFRIGTLPDTQLIARRLAPYRMMICATPDYLARMGRPDHPCDLARHEAVRFTPTLRSAWKLAKGDQVVEVDPLGAITVNSGQAVLAAGRAGLGVVMQPAILVARHVKSGELVQLFPDWALGERSMSLLYYRDRRMTPRLRSFISFALQEFSLDRA